MLPACKAVIIGRDEAQTRSLLAIARKIGFAIIEAPATGDVPTPRTLINFVLVHHQIGDKLLLSTINAIRGGGPDVRFSPIVVIGNDCDFETVLHFVHLGVDDVISLPEKREVLAQRLGQQLWSEQLYIETADYFGPDRRRFEMGGDDRRAGLAGHARYYIQRLPDVGTRIVRHELHPAPHFSPRVYLAG